MEEEALNARGDPKLGAQASLEKYTNDERFG